MTISLKFETKNMVKAEQKRTENIAEYIIYMFQTEDLVRALKLDLNQITNIE